MFLRDELQLPEVVEVRVSPLEVVVSTCGFNIKKYGPSCPQDVFLEPRRINKKTYFFWKRGHTRFETHLRYIPL